MRCAYYKSTFTLIPIWTCGIQLWECAKKSNVNIIQRYQNKTLMITVVPWYVNNQTIHNDLKIKYDNEQIQAHE